MKPLLAAAAPSDLDALPYPLIASPKLDGIRCLTIPGHGAVTRALKPIPNAHVRAMLSNDPLMANLDGEIIVGDPTSPTTFNTTTSAVMSRAGEPAFAFYVFDDLTNPAAAFTERFARLAERDMLDLPAFVKIVEHRIVNSAAELEAYEVGVLAQGYEGVMLRHPDKPYKFGRSTLNEAILLKLKRFADIEAEVVGCEELYRNGNEATVNALGYTERSTHKDNLVPAGTLGALICKAPQFELPFNVGTGLTQAQRDSFWAERTALVGRLAKIKFQECGTKDRPRLPVFQGFRDPADL